MLVMTLEKVPQSLRGELTRWLLEAQTGVYVGRVSPVVRDLLWHKALEKGAGGRCVQVWRTNSEQGFDLRMSGDQRRQVVGIDGLKLVAVKNAAWKELISRGTLTSPRP